MARIDPTDPNSPIVTLENAHQQASWPLGEPWADEHQYANGEDPQGRHINQLTAELRVGTYTFGSALERNRAGVVEVWPLTQADNPFGSPAAK